MASPYAATIRALAPRHDPRHVEAFMRSEHGTLDALSPDQFASEVTTGVACIEQGGTGLAEQLAQTFGL